MKLSLLVVDDEVAMCELLSVYFKLKGLQVTTVQSANEAAPIIEKGDFDLLILDWHLDGVNGLDLLNLSKARHPQLPVIIFAGDCDNQAFLRKVLAGRADAVLRKMGSLDELSAVVLGRLRDVALCAGK